MSLLGGWKINVVLDAMPQKVATAFSALATQLIGAEYTPIAYLGAQVVNGTNHAVLAEQVLTTGRDTKNIVLIIFNEKGMDCTLVNIERVVEGGFGAGGVEINVKKDIPEEAQKAFDASLAEFVGSTVKPFAYLGSQVVSGIDYIFAAEVAPVVPDPANKIAIVTVNGLTKKIYFQDVL